MTSSEEFLFIRKSDFQRMNDDLKILAQLTTCGVKRLARIDTFYQSPASNIKQAGWNSFRLSIVIAKSISTIQFAATSIPLPYLEEMLGNEIAQSLIVRIASILDDELDIFINNNKIPVSKKPRLYDRIEAVKKRFQMMQVFKN